MKDPAGIARRLLIGALIASAGAAAVTAPGNARAAPNVECTFGDPLAGLMASFAAPTKRRAQAAASGSVELTPRQLKDKAKQVCKLEVTKHGGDRGRYDHCAVVPFQPKNLGACLLHIYVKAAKCRVRPSARTVIAPDGVRVTFSAGQCSEQAGERGIHEHLTVIKTGPKPPNNLIYVVRPLPE